MNLSAATQRLRHIHSDVAHAACLFKLPQISWHRPACKGKVVSYKEGFSHRPQEIEGGPDDDFKMQEVMLTLCSFSAAFGCMLQGRSSGG